MQNQNSKSIKGDENQNLSTGTTESPRPAQEREAIQLLLNLVSDLTDMGKCVYDHHGYCQEHGWFDSGLCPHSRARSLFDTDGNPKPMQLIIERLKAR